MSFISKTNLLDFYYFKWMLSNGDVKANFWMISWRFLSAMSLVSTLTKQSYNGDALVMTLKFLSRGPNG
jgi:hypothetical protein